MIGRSLFALLLMAAACCGAAAQETTLKAITYAPPGKFEESMKVFEMFVERVNKAGAGKLKVQHLGGPEVVPLPDQVNAVGKGVADIVMTVTVHAALVPEIDTVGLSNITPAEERANGYLDLLDEAHKKINIKVIGRVSTNSGFFIFSKAPIRKLEDFKGIKIRSHSGYDPLFKSVGAVPVGIAIPEIYSALERGLVTAAPYPLFVHDLGLHEVTKYVLADAFWPSHTTFIFMNRRKFEGLPKEQQELIVAVQKQLERDMIPAIAELMKVERGKLEKSGLTFVHLAPDEAKTWRQLANESRWKVLEARIPAEQAAKYRKLLSGEK